MERWDSISHLTSCPVWLIWLNQRRALAQLSITVSICNVSWLVLPWWNASPEKNASVRLWWHVSCWQSGDFCFLYCSSSHHYFKYCKISALALLKMVMHARSGGNLEVMGLMLGKVDGETMIIMDSFALPVEGTETRVNAQAAAYEYMAAYIENAKQVWDCLLNLYLCDKVGLCIISDCNGACQNNVMMASPAR